MAKLLSYYIDLYSKLMGFKIDLFKNSMMVDKPEPSCGELLDDIITMARDLLEKHKGV